MTIHLITGRAGEPHVTSVDAGKFNANVFGRGRYVLDGCECTVIDSNNLSIAEGVMLVDGRQVNIEGTGEPVVIENGQSGYNRIDLVCLRYQRSEGIETIDISTIKGQPTSGEPVAPTGPGSILDGDALAYIPIFSVRITGTNVEQPIMLLESFALYTLGLGEEILAGADLNDYTTPGCYRIPWGRNVANSPIGDYEIRTLVVTNPFGSIDSFVQELHSLNGNQKWTRSRYNQEWDAWHCTGGVDSIVSEGDSNGWHWVKYANGTAIASLKNFVEMNVTNRWQSYYAQQLDRVAYPFTFKDMPAELVSLSTNGANAWITSGWNQYETISSIYNIVAPNAITGFQAYVNYLVIGRWK